MKRQILCAMGLAVLLTASAQATQEELAKSIRETYLETTQTSQQLNSTLIALTKLTEQTKGNLRPAYDTFCSAVAKTDSDATTTRKRVDWMQGDAQKYFKEWQGTVSGIANESLRKKAQKRLNAVKESFDKVQTSLLRTGEKFKPFLSNLTDIQKALASDVTSGGVKAIRSTVKSANSDFREVNDEIGSALKEMRKMEKALSTEAS